jgi:hypothetical protein
LQANKIVFYPIIALWVMKGLEWDPKDSVELLAIIEHNITKINTFSPMQANKTVFYPIMALWVMKDLE